MGRTKCSHSQRICITRQLTYMDETAFPLVYGWWVDKDGNTFNTVPEWILHTASVFRMKGTYTEEYLVLMTITDVMGSPESWRWQERKLFWSANLGHQQQLKFVTFMEQNKCHPNLAQHWMQVRTKMLSDSKDRANVANLYKVTGRAETAPPKSGTRTTTSLGNCGTSGGVAPTCEEAAGARDERGACKIIDEWCALLKILWKMCAIFPALLQKSAVDRVENAVLYRAINR